MCSVEDQALASARSEASDQDFGTFSGDVPGKIQGEGYMRAKLIVSIVALGPMLFGLVSAKEFRKVRMGIADPNISMAPFYLARVQHYYGSEGLDVDFIVMRGPVA